MQEEFMEKFFFYSRIITGIIMLTMPYVASVRYFTFVSVSVPGLATATTLFIIGIIVLIKLNWEKGL